MGNSLLGIALDIFLSAIAFASDNFLSANIFASAIFLSAIIFASEILLSATCSGVPIVDFAINDGETILYITTITTNTTITDKLIMTFNDF